MTLPRTPEEMQKAMVENAGGKADLSKIRGASDAAKKRRAALARQSEKQKLREAFLEGIKAERMRVGPRCEICGVEGWDADLELHHIVKRSQGARFDGEKYGVDHPQNLQLLCRHCHETVESHPQWDRVERATGEGRR